MKFLLDQDVYAATARFLRNLGHDVVTASEAGCSEVSDLQLLAQAQEQRRILVTRDRDFGNLVFLRELGTGVIYIRALPSTLLAGHEQLPVVLASYTEDQLRDAFVVVEPGRHRFRTLSGRR